MVYGYCASQSYCIYRVLFGDTNLMKFYNVKYLQYPLLLISYLWKPEQSIEQTQRQEENDGIGKTAEISF